MVGTMRGRLVSCVAAALLTMGVGAAVADAGMGPVREGVEGPETIAEARRMIEALPWEFTFTHPPRDTRNALIIRTTDAQEKSFRFFLFRGRAPRDIDVPGYHLENLGGGEVGKSFVIFSNEAKNTQYESHTLPFHTYEGDSGITKAMQREYFEIQFGVQDAVCELSTGKPCPAL
jgi:hypothetical protein